MIEAFLYQASSIYVRVCYIRFMTKGCFKYLLCFVLMSSSFLLVDAQSYSFEIHWGLERQLSNTLTVVQDNQPDIIIKNAPYKSKALIAPRYWVIRANYWKEDKGWDLEVIHHKVFLLDNTHPDIQRFGISHGLNTMVLNKSIQKQQFIFRGGLGAIIAHPENTIRGLALPERQGFLGLGYWTGPTMNLSIGRQVDLYKTLYLSLDAKYQVSYVKVPVVDGHAQFMSNIFQLAVGLGFKLDRE